MAPILALAIMIIVNEMLIFILEPGADSSSKSMWANYAEVEQIDTIFVGSSLCKEALDPAQFDAEMGTQSAMMATNAQGLSQTYESISTAIHDHQIKTAIIGFGFFQMQYRQGHNAEVAFYRAKTLNEDGVEKVRDILSYVTRGDNIGTPVSINYFFPWIYNSCDISVDGIWTNVEAKLAERKTHKENEVEKERKTESNIEAQDHQLVQTNYHMDANILDYNNVTPRIIEDCGAKKWDGQASKELLRIGQLCRENGVDLIVVLIPNADFFISAYGYDRYFEDDAVLKSLCDEMGAEYYDFNLAIKELYAPKTTEYKDYEHLNGEGKKRLTHSLAVLLKEREQGEDVSDLFITQDDYMRTQDFLSCVNFTHSLKGDELHLDVHTYPDLKRNTKITMKIKNLETGKERQLLKAENQSHVVFQLDESNRYLATVSATAPDGTERHYIEEVILNR